MRALLLLACLARLLHASSHDGRAIIKSTNGDLILQPALNKNIQLRTNGPESKVLLNGHPIQNHGSGDLTVTDSSLDVDARQQLAALLQRVRQLEARVAAANGSLPAPAPEPPAPAVTTVPRLARLRNRVARLEALVRGRNNHCQSNPCLHGGTCLNLPADYHCLCPTAWEGRDCQDDVNECRQFLGTELGCQNAATCLNRPGSYECLCRSGWFGLHCTRREKDCASGNYEMCGHGVCHAVSTGDGVNCVCDQGWTKNATGGPCLTDVDECAPGGGARCSVSPRVACLNLPGSFSCGACPPGFEGDGFSCADVDECAIDNGGCSPLVPCHNTPGSRVCGRCPPGYLGDGVTCTWRGFCGADNGGCHPSAQCVATPLAVCVCPPGMAGDGFGPHGCYVLSSNSSRDCAAAACGAHGTCRALPKGYSCLCEEGYGGAHCDAPVDTCASRPCRNGGTCRADAAAAGGFRCECAPRFAGRLCEGPAVCAHSLVAAEGSIVFPYSNATYDHSAKCVWLISIAPDKVVNITFTKFDVESSPDCLKEFLQIHDGLNTASQLIGRFCGSVPKGGNIISSHNKVYLWFLSGRLGAGRGFALRWQSTTPACGGELAADSHGRLSSPGAPGHYPPGRDCYWHLYAPLGKRIQLHFYELDIETHSNCSYDFLAIYDGSSSSDPLLNRFCNSSQPSPITSTSSDIYIHFHSDASGSGNGFQIAYAAVPGLPGCGGLYSADSGEIQPPLNNGKYLGSLLCEYEIKTKPGTKIRLNFKSFQLEYSPTCTFDYLKIYDGGGVDSPIVGTFCGNTPPKSYTSSSNKLYIKLKTDENVAYEGFRITYEAICHHTITGDSGIIKSPRYPFAYPNNELCEYILSTTPGKAIVLTFQDIDIEYNPFYKCKYDYVEVRDGHDGNATSLGAFCGAATPPALTSTFNYLYVKFVSDTSNVGTGFYANFTTIDVKCGGIHRDATGLINYPESATEYEAETTCTWLLLAPPGHHIKLNWNRFDLEHSYSANDCTTDYLELVEINESNEHESIGKFCGNKSPPSLTTTTNKLQMMFVADESIEESGFSVSYSFLNDEAHCGGVFRKSHGVLSSPGWPDSYKANLDCVWVLSVPPGQQVKLNISQFALEKAYGFSTCNYVDYVEIRNGATEHAPLIGKYCGNSVSNGIPKRITSFGNSLFIRFVSDGFITGSGFYIEWDGTVAGCGGTLSAPSGSLSSPNYPSNYDDNTECFYKIAVSQGSRIKIDITELELEKTFRCRDDYIEIFDGRDGSAKSLGRFCELSKAESLNVITSSNLAHIKFRSDVANTGKGFLLNYHTLCKNISLSGSHGVIESPGYPETYPAGDNCLWNIDAPKGNKINITFTEMGLYYYAFHRFVVPVPVRDYIEVIESGVVTKQYSLSTLPERFTSKGNSVQIKFVSQPHRAFSYLRTKKPKFRIEWNRHGCGGILKRSYGLLTFDKSSAGVGEIECEWIIESNYGSRVSITFSDIYLNDSPNCTTDSIEVYDGQSIEAPLIARLCHRRGASVSASGSLMLVRLAKHSRLLDAYFKSNYYPTTSTCGSRMQSISGIIYSKNYPKDYDNDLDCIWHIAVPEYHRIEINFVDFDLHDDRNCGDRIRIYDKGDIIRSNYSYLICPNSNISKIVTESNTVGIQFVSNSDGTAKGFKANFTVTCGATININSDGILQNDDFHKHYNRNCTWTLIAPTPSQKISLTLSHLSLPNYLDTDGNRRCPSSFLRVLDGDDDEAPLITELCGMKVPPTIISRGSAMTIILGSYAGPTVGKFIAHYTSVDNACGGELTSEEGSIASPNYPRLYPNSAYCEWTLKASQGNRIYITFEAFDLEDSDNCNLDYLEIRENNGGGRLLGLYCGKDVPIATNATSTLYIKFHTDDEDAAQGFLLHFGYLHNNEISGKSGEISSPLYPNKYNGQSDFSWSVSTLGSDPIAINVIKLEIPNFGGNCENALLIYDGLDDEAPLLKTLCGVGESNVMSTSNIVFIKLKLDETNTGATFYLKWKSASRTAFTSGEGKNNNCGNNETELIPVGGSKMINSPKYPERYENNLDCQWIFKATPGRHLVMSLIDMKLEEYMECKADYISIYSSKTGLNDWKPLSEHFCTLSSPIMSNIFDASTYLKVKFISDVSNTQMGFSARIKSSCGGFLSDLSGYVGVKWEDWRNAFSLNYYCEWNIKVRPGRTILLDFRHFNISNSDQCNNYLSLRNGDSIESPLLGSGKYCGHSEEKRSSLETSGNHAFIRFSLIGLFFQNFLIHYEEKNVECGSTSVLDADRGSELIMSPNYPHVPPPFSECVWRFTAPPGEILRIDFLDRMDLERDCEKEFVEIRDGPTDSSLLIKDRLCGSTIPDSIRSTSNEIFIRYLTQLSEPRNGFKANVTIDTCGGTIHSNSGEISSPGYPHLHALAGLVCEWRIVGLLRFLVLNIKPLEIDLPEPERTCETNITIYDVTDANKRTNLVKTICSDGEADNNLAVLQTLTNEAVIKLHIGKAGSGNQLSEYRGFRFSFNTTRQTCGGIITSSEGYLATPSYPRKATIRYCSWFITVPNKARRVKLLILDSNESVGPIKQRLLISDDPFHLSRIEPYSTTNQTDGGNVYESSGNRMVVTITMTMAITECRFKAKFTSDEPAICGGSLSANSGEIRAPVVDRPFYCQWNIEQDNMNDQVNLKDEQMNSNTSIMFNGTISSSTSKDRCNTLDSKIEFKMDIGIGLPIRVCKNATFNLRIPVQNVVVKALRSKGSTFDFDISYTKQPCGGSIVVGANPTNVITLPASHDGPLDCAWAIKAPTTSYDRIEIKLNGNFKLSCSEEFLLIGLNVIQDSRSVGDYCRDRMQTDVVSTNFRIFYVQYHSDKNTSDIQLVVNTINYSDSSKCGGLLTSSNNVFVSPKFPRDYINNLECTWEIQSDLGTRVALSFQQKFAVEQATNCSKDAVIIYDWVEDSYVQMAKLCGRDLPGPFNATSNKMKVVFRTDADTTLDGFKAAWAPICGGVLTATEQEQFIYSPRYPSKYLPNKKCEYEIRALKHIVLKFIDFDVEGPFPECDFDNVTIEDRSPYYQFSPEVYCGYRKPSTKIVYSAVSIKFQTDRYTEKKGFKVSYSLFSCGGTIKTPTVLTESVDYPETDELNCTWIIEAPTGKVVVLKISDRKFGNCENDYLAVFDSALIDDTKKIATLCGRDNDTTVLRSSGKDMTLQLVSYFAQVEYKIEVFFSYGNSVGCGGTINLISTQTIRSPLIGGSSHYENLLDCHWSLKAPPFQVIEIEFTSFNISPCINQTANTECECDVVELRDGLNPNSLIMGSYCGQALPPKLTSSSDTMSVRLSTDGETSSTGFIAKASVRPSRCGPTHYHFEKTVQTIRTPNYEFGTIPRGLHCTYTLTIRDMTLFDRAHIGINNMDLMPGAVETNSCNKDKVIVQIIPETHNSTGKDLIINKPENSFFSPLVNLEDYVTYITPKYVFCGVQKSHDLYVAGHVQINVITDPEGDGKNHRGVEISFSLADYCPRNYSEPQGRIFATLNLGNGVQNCFTLITAPENHTISLYFLAAGVFYNKGFLKIYDGDKLSAPEVSTSSDNSFEKYPVFSNGRYLLLHSHVDKDSQMSFDLNFVTTDKGRGCGGKLSNVQGTLTSPFYPSIYRQIAECEWELETPMGTFLELKFDVFDLGSACDENYVQLVDRRGVVFATYCAEQPAIYRSNDNYVKVVSKTNKSNGGLGWVAMFFATERL